MYCDHNFSHIPFLILLPYALSYRASYTLSSISFRVSGFMRGKVFNPFRIGFFVELEIRIYFYSSIFGYSAFSAPFAEGNFKGEDFIWPIRVHHSLSLKEVRAVSQAGIEDGTTVTHIIEGESQLLQFDLWPPHVYCGTSTFQYTHANTDTHTHTHTTEYIKIDE